MKAALWTRRTHLFHADDYICSACKVSNDKPYMVCLACGAPMKKAKYEPSWVDEAAGISAMLDDGW